jgi:hypothetical protein
MVWDWAVRLSARFGIRLQDKIRWRRGVAPKKTHFWKLTLRNHCVVIYVVWGWLFHCKKSLYIFALFGNRVTKPVIQVTNAASLEKHCVAERRKIHVRSDRCPRHLFWRMGVDLCSLHTLYLCESLRICFWITEPIMKIDFVLHDSRVNLSGLLHKSLPSIFVCKCIAPVVTRQMFDKMYPFIARQRLGENFISATNTSDSALVLAHVPNNCWMCICVWACLCDALSLLGTASVKTFRREQRVVKTSFSLRAVSCQRKIK